MDAGRRTPAYMLYVHVTSIHRVPSRWLGETWVKCLVIPTARCMLTGKFPSEKKNLSFRTPRRVPRVGHN